MSNTAQFNFIKLHETDKAVLVGLEKERIPTPGLIVKDKECTSIVTYGRCWLPKSRCLMTQEEIEVPEWLLTSKNIDAEENQFMLFDTDGGF